MRCSLRVPASIALAAALAAGGCGSASDKGVADSKFVSALGLTTKGGNYVIAGNPFCSVSKLLGDPTAVRDAASSHLVIASKDGAVGIKVITPFAPSCKKSAEQALQKLAKQERKSQ